MPPRSRALSEADQSAWATYAKMIAPLRGRAAGPGAETPPVERPQRDPVPPARPAPSVIVRPPRAPTPPLSVGGQPGGLDSATWQRFRSGKLAPARTLDLHGLTVQHAFHSLVTFLRNAQAERLRCVEVVTGRGNGATGGAIKRELPLWLNLPDIRPLVLGAAHPHALNPGSVRLLLRRVR